MQSTVLCSFCEEEFSSTAEMLSHADSRHKNKKVEPPAPQGVPPVREVKTKPIKLVYKYEGHCPTCTAPVDTLEISIKSSLHCIAYCPRCKSQLHEQEVKKL